MVSLGVKREMLARKSYEGREGTARRKEGRERVHARLEDNSGVKGERGIKKSWEGKKGAAEEEG